MNVLDHLKQKTSDEVKVYCKNTCIDAGVAMMHVSGDFNLSTLVRNANFFGFKEAMYVGGSKQWDRRGTVGTHHYTDLNHIKTEVDFVNYVKDSGYTLIAVENNIPKYSDKTISIFNQWVFTGVDKPMFVFGEEKSGLSDYILDNAETIVTIREYGSVRSLNVGTTSGIVMAFYRNYYDY
jgi:tRNA (guanosine-2'-O-)-methyltransferase